MAARATAEISGDTLALAGVLDFESVLALDAQGRSWLQGDAPSVCNINLGAVSYSSSVGIALLLGWQRVALQQRKTLHILQLPADMVALVRVGGLDDLLAGV
jgi:phospholipid transport system transporter-binding protein